MEQYDAVVTDANQRVALEVIRCLGMMGLSVCAVESSTIRRPLGFASKYCSSRIQVSSYEDEEFDNIAQQAKAVFPISTNTILALLRCDYDQRNNTLLPGMDTFQEVNNKDRVLHVASRCQVPVPESMLITRGSEIPENPAFGYPAVIKLINDEGLFLPPRQRYRIAHGPGELKSGCSSLLTHGKDLLVQQYIDGEAYGYSALYDADSNYLAGIGHKRLRQYPMAGGPSTYCVSVSEDALQQAALSVLSEVSWQGPAMVEFKKDSRDGRFKLIEINPRYWGSMPLARFSGLNLPYLHYLAITKGNIENTAREYQLGTRLKFRFMDLRACFDEVRRQPSQIFILCKCIAETINPRIRDGIISFKDPAPAFRYLFNKMTNN